MKAAAKPFWLAASLLLAVLYASALRSQDIYPEPPATEFALPAGNGAWISPDLARGECQVMAADKWIKGMSGGRDVFVAAELQNGSGRLWHLQLGVFRQDKGSLQVERYVCIDATTLGWRTLRNFEDKALPWLEDIDGDGDDEFVLWSSFSMNRSELGHFGLIAWVYTLQRGNVVALNTDLTRQMTKRIVSAYRRQLPGVTELQQQQRDEIAAALVDYLARKKGHYE